MNEEILFLESGTRKVYNYLKNNGRGSVITINELREIEHISYTSLRSILVHLCDNGTLLRISRGVYCFPHIEQGHIIFPKLKTILDKIASVEKFSYCPIGEYSKYILGFTNIFPKDIVCYTSGKVKFIRIIDGTTIRLLPTKKVMFSQIQSYELLVLNQYILKVGVSTISFNEREQLKSFIGQIDTSIIQKEFINLSEDVINLLT